MNNLKYFDTHPSEKKASPCLAATHSLSCQLGVRTVRMYIKKQSNNNWINAYKRYIFIYRLHCFNCKFCQIPSDDPGNLFIHQACNPHPGRFIQHLKCAEWKKPPQSNWFGHHGESLLTRLTAGVSVSCPCLTLTLQVCQWQNFPVKLIVWASTPQVLVWPKKRYYNARGQIPCGCCGTPSDDPHTEERTNIPPPVPAPLELHHICSLQWKHHWKYHLLFVTWWEEVERKIEKEHIQSQMLWWAIDPRSPNNEPPPVQAP